MNALLNPYIAGAPVVEASMFFGRQDVFQWIEHNLAGKYVNHILVIHGQRRVGKTSVLKQIPNFLPNTYLQVFFDLQGRTSTTLDRFLWWLAREIARVLKQENGLAVPVPDREVFASDPEYLVAQFLPGLLPLLGERKLLLTFDEFDTLEQPEIRESLAQPLIHYLRRMFELESLSFIFSIGSSGHKLENMQSSYTDFFKTALYRKISFLGKEDCLLLVTRPVAEILEYEPKASERIYAVTAGHPYFTQLVCHELFTLCQKTGKRTLSAEDVDGILDDVIERGTVNLKFTWDEASSLEKWIMACLAQADGGSSLVKLNEMLHQQRVRYSDPDLNAAQIHLRDKDILTEENRFVIYLLQRWLRKNRPLDRVREELVEVNPIANRYIEIGEEYRSLGQAAKAIESFQQALAVDALNLKAQVGIAHVHLDQKDHLSAVQAFEKALRIDDEDVTARTGLCDTCLALGDMARQHQELEEAKGYYQRILTVNPEHSEARQHLAEIFCQQAEAALSQQQESDALAAFQAALKFTPEDEALGQRCVQLQGLVREKAITAMLESSRNEAVAGRWEAAINGLEAGLQAYPGEPRLQQALAGSLTARREVMLVSLRARADGLAAAEKWAAALEVWQEYLSLEPQDAAQVQEEMQRLEARRSLAEAYLQGQQALEAKDFSRATSLLKKVILVDETYKDSARLLALAIDGRRKQRPAIQLPRLHINWRVGAILAGVVVLAGLVFLGVRFVPGWVARLRISPTPTSGSSADATFIVGVLHPITAQEPAFTDDFTTWNPTWGEPEPGVKDVWLEGEQMVLTPPEGAKAYLESTSIHALNFVLQFGLGFDIPQGLVDTEKYAVVVVDFRAAEDAPGYSLYIELNRAESDLYNWKITGGGAELSGETSLLRHDNPNKVTLYFSGDECAVLINDQVLAHFKDTMHTGSVNRIGAWTDQGTIKVVIDDLRFWDLGEGELEPTPPPTQQAATPAPTATAGPAWVADSAAPILESISLASPNFQDHFDYPRAEWQPQGSVKIDQGMAVFSAGTTDELPTLRGSPLQAEAFVLQFDLRAEFPQGEAQDDIMNEFYLAVDITFSADEKYTFYLSFDDAPGLATAHIWGVYQFPENILVVQGETLPFDPAGWTQLTVMFSNGTLGFYLAGQPLGYVDGLPSTSQEVSISAGSKESPFVLYINDLQLWDLDNLNTASPDEPDPDFLAGRLPDFEDDFETQKSEWRLVTTGESKLENGTLILDAGEISLSSMGDVNLDARDFQVQYDFQLLSLGGEGAALTLVFRATEQTKYVFNLMFTPDRVDWNITKGDQVDLAEGSLTGIDLAAVHQFRATGIGSQFWFYLDGQLVASLQHSDLAEGGFGLIAACPDGISTLAIDNLKFWNLEQVPLALRFGSAEEREFMQVVTRSNRPPDLTGLISEPLSGWTAHDPDDINQIEFTDGVGSLSLPEGGDFKFLHPEMEPARDFALQYDVQILEGSSDTHVCVAFRFFEEGIFHLEFYPEANLIKLSDPTDRILAEISNPMITYDTWLRVVLVVRGDKLAVYLNGESQIFVRSSFLPGQPLFFLRFKSSTAASAQFDNLLFWNLEDAWAWELPAPVQQAVLDTPPTFADDFSTEKVEWQVEPGYQGGQFAWIDGALRILGACPGDQLFQAIDYVFQSDIRFSEVSLDRVFSYAFRSTYTGEGIATEYLWSVNTLTRQWSLSVNLDPAGNQYQPLRSGWVDRLEAGQWATLTVVVYQDTVWIFWNGELEAHYQGLELSGELTHFVFTNDMDLYFELDNLKFWNLSSSSGSSIPSPFIFSFAKDLSWKIPSASAIPCAIPGAFLGAGKSCARWSTACSPAPMRAPPSSASGVSARPHF